MCTTLVLSLGKALIVILYHLLDLVLVPVCFVSNQRNAMRKNINLDGSQSEQNLASSIGITVNALHQTNVSLIHGFYL